MSHPQIGDIMHYQVTGELVSLKRFTSRGEIDVIIKDGDGNLTSGQLKHAEKFGAKEILINQPEEATDV